MNYIPFFQRLKILINHLEIILNIVNIFQPIFTERISIVFVFIL